MRRKLLSIILGGFILLSTCVPGRGETGGTFRGTYCEGSGNIEFLQLIDESFQFFHANPRFPNLTMLYQSKWDTFNEGAGWGAWWIQNSYGFSYCATPFLAEPWISVLQRSWDMFWDGQGDGKRMGLWGPAPNVNQLWDQVAPDGCLGDAVKPGKIAYKQGDGPATIHDWFYEATAAGVVMQSEILLRSRDPEAIRKYIPKMERACDFIERARDPKNNLFLVGPACNLLAPSYGGVKMPDGSFGKGYLAGLSINYAAALDRMIELYKLSGDREKQKTYEHRLKITRNSFKLLLTDKGYFVKSVEPDGTMHGVVGRKQFGYMEGVANADAMCFRTVSDKTAQSIYKQIASFPEIRPFDFLLTNAPGLDDTYWNWGNSTGPGLDGIHEFGCWVNGGVWGTVEGRAIMGYYRVNRTEDVFKSADRAMKWAKDYRMDAPFTQRGENTKNVWSDTGNAQIGGVSVMVDNFAIPAATVRGLFECIYKSDRMIFYPHVPQSIDQYRQHEPVWFGKKRITLGILNGPGKIASVKVNGKPVEIEASDHFSLAYNDLPDAADVVIVMEGARTGAFTLLSSGGARRQAINKPALPEFLVKPYSVLLAMKGLLKHAPDADYERAFVSEAIASFEARRECPIIDFGPGFFRPVTPERKQGIVKFHEMAAMSMYDGFAGMMKRYAEDADHSRKRIAELFKQAGG